MALELLGSCLAEQFFTEENSFKADILSSTCGQYLQDRGT